MKTVVGLFSVLIMTPFTSAMDCVLQNAVNFSSSQIELK